MNDATVNRHNVANQTFDTRQPYAITAREPKTDLGGACYFNDCTTLPGTKKVLPQLEKLSTDTLQKLATTRTDYGRTKVLDRFVQSLNAHLTVQTSYPGKPVYTYSTQDLNNLKNFLHVQRHHAELAGQGDKVKNVKALLDAVDTALDQRSAIPDLLPPQPLPLFPKDEYPFIQE